MSKEPPPQSVHSSATRMLAMTTGDETRVLSPGLTARPPLGAPTLATRLERSDGEGRLGRYVVLRVLGRGGMGVVFSAYSGLLS